MQCLSMIRLLDAIYFQVIKTFDLIKSLDLRQHANSCQRPALRLKTPRKEAFRIHLTAVKYDAQSETSHAPPLSSIYMAVTTHQGSLLLPLPGNDVVRQSHINKHPAKQSPREMLPVASSDSYMRLYTRKAPVKVAQSNQDNAPESHGVIYLFVSKKARNNE